MIDALFGSKTRVKLLHLFLNNPGKSFYVREITRLIDEQINSVRRELSNMLGVGIIKSDTADNKLYYEVNQRYEYYVPLRAIFGDNVSPEVFQTKSSNNSLVTSIQAKVDELSNTKLAVLAGVFVQGSTSEIDIFIAGKPAQAKLKALIGSLEKKEGREINYAVMPYDEFYYRLSIHDRFVTQLLRSKHVVLRDDKQVLMTEK